MRRRMVVHEHAVNQFAVQRLAASKAPHFVVHFALPMRLRAVNEVLPKIVAFYNKRQATSSVLNDSYRTCKNKNFNRNSERMHNGKCNRKDGKIERKHKGRGKRLNRHCRKNPKNGIAFDPWYRDL
ncbi:hypothetical protein C0J52_05501 [Blattella germanica]|nr:hypothetical protein C0J52_05501 [Blattella germanica]